MFSTLPWQLFASGRLPSSGIPCSTGNPKIPSLVMAGLVPDLYPQFALDTGRCGTWIAPFARRAGVARRCLRAITEEHEHINAEGDPMPDTAVGLESIPCGGPENPHGSLPFRSLSVPFPRRCRLVRRGSRPTGPLSPDSTNPARVQRLCGTWSGLVPAIHVGPTLESLRQASRRGYPAQGRA